MHVSSKDSSKDGKEHIITSLLEADGPFELLSDKAELTGEIASLKRTTGGGVEVVVKVNIAEPQPEPVNEG